MSRTIDLHHHVIPGFYWQASNEDGNAAGGITPARWSLDGAIAYLDAAEIDVAVPSISTPGVHFGDDAEARTLALRVNEYLAELRRDRPDRRVRRAVAARRRRGARSARVRARRARARRRVADDQRRRPLSRRQPLR